MPSRRTVEVGSAALMVAGVAALVCVSLVSVNGPGLLVARAGALALAFGAIARILAALAP